MATDKLKYTIAIDFDGTIVTHEYPKVGKLAPFAKEVINALADAGHFLFLWTMRSEQTLVDALDFMAEHDIPITETRAPVQMGTALKQVAHVYIDDRGLGCPVMDFHGKRVVNWAAVAFQLTTMGILSIDAYERIIGE